jgi:hypothetical protein
MSRKTRKQMAEHLVRPVEFVSEIEAMYQDGARRLPRGRPEGDPEPADRQDPRRAARTGRSRSTTAAASPACSVRSRSWRAPGVAFDVAAAVRPPRLSRRRSRAARVAGAGSRAPRHAWLLNGSYARPCRRAAAADRGHARAGRRRCAGAGRAARATRPQ